LGAGIGHFTSPEDASEEERLHRTLIGGGIGLGSGALLGGLGGYQRAKTLATAASQQLPLIELAHQRFGA
jgi:uncharacterized membrane protein